MEPDLEGYAQLTTDDEEVSDEEDSIHSEPSIEEEEPKILGGIFFTELLNKNLVDEIHLFKSKIIIGKHGKPAIVGKKLSQLNLSLNERKKFKDDIYTNYQVN